MTTREALARMPDAGAFESLATATLRCIEIDCRAVIHHGTNALGKPIKSLVDAWCLVPESSPPRFVMLQHTTVAEPSLNSKWLQAGSGDLYKAGEQAAKLRREFPTARFRLFLTTNRIPSNKLQALVYQAAERLGLEAVIVDQSRLSDFLDSPAGQYLRRNCLGIEVDSLSEELLAELSSKSVDLHAQEFLTGGVVSRVEREIDKQLKAALSDPSITLHCLVADPGFGKSTTAQFILREHIEAGGFGLWLSESTLAGATSLGDAITRSLCSLYPALSPDAASSWSAVCGTRRLLLIIDDINRAANSVRLLQRLQGWTALANENSAGQARYHDPIVAICPVWTHFWEASRDPTKVHSWVRSTSMGPMEPSEGADAVEKIAASQGLTLTRKEAEQCAANLNDDPYLIGVFGALLNDKTTRADLRQLTENVIRKYVDYMLRRASSRSNEAFTATDLQETLRAMATQMLLKKDLRPSWSKMRAWLKEFPPPIPQAAEFLKTDAGICRLAEGDVLTFRHDRLMQFLAVECLPHLLKFQDVINEVYYAEAIGQVLARTTIDESQLASIAAAWGEDVRKIQPQPEAFWDTSEGRKRPHASVVWYSLDSNPIVGNTARAKMGALGGDMGHRFVRSIKRSLGDDRPHELVGGQRALGFEIAAQIFQHIRQHASSSRLLRGQEIRECVVTVPVTFSGRQRKVIRRAVERAGMQLKGFLHEPFAAMISHFYDPDRKLAAARDQRVLVFDWGGGTLDVCIVQVSKDGKRVVELVHGGIEDHAGDDFDHRVMAYLRTLFLNRHKDLADKELELQGDVRDRFWLNAEAGKIELSKAQRAAVTVANFYQKDGHIFDLQENLTRNEFEGLITAEVDAALRCVQRCLDSARLSAGTVDHVLLVGGTSNIPLVRERLETLFGHKVQVAHEPDAAIARGAAIVAAEGWRLFNALAVGVKLCDGTLFDVLNARVPLQASSSRRLVFYCTDWRIGSANLIFARQRVSGDREVVTLGTTLQVPTKNEVDHEDDLDRIVADFTVTPDATLHCVAQSTTLGKRVECEIHDISFGLEAS